jgi:hypothetical protein
MLNHTFTETPYINLTRCPLLTLAQVAELTHRSPEGLRFTIRGKSELAALLRAARVRIGRRVLFRASGIARLLDSGASCNPSAEG